MERESKHRLVSDALGAASGPLSANELWGELRATGIGLATVYRALKTGIADDTLRAVEMPGGPTRYEPKTRGHHHHFICNGCDRAYDMEGCVKGLEKILPARFSMTGHEILLFGLCDRCQAA